MPNKNLLIVQRVSDNLIAGIQSRDVALWIRDIPKDADAARFATFVGLPWALVISEAFDAKVFDALTAPADLHDPMTRRRGFVQVIEDDPAQIQLPPRCVPVYLLNSRDSSASTDFTSQLRRMNMLDRLRRSGIRELVVLNGLKSGAPEELKALWGSGFRSYLTFVSEESGADLESWISVAEGLSAANQFRGAVWAFAREVLEKYEITYPASRRIVRVRDVSGKVRQVDVTEIDEPERPILDRFSLIEERDLTPILPEELGEEDFIGFFQNSTNSWRAYAAGLPWIRDPSCTKRLGRLLQRLDAVGANENFVAYIAAESGAGGTTLAHALAWEFAREGYPVLLAKGIPFTADPLSIGNFLNRFRLSTEAIKAEEVQASAEEVLQASDESKEISQRRYETPWLVVFDTVHWQHRDGELVRFRNELAKQGRPVCVLVVTPPLLGLSFYNTSIFKSVAELNHTLTQEEARQLGRHLNRFLRNYGKDRSEWDWDAFYQSHTVRYIEGIAAFWVTLSFWIQSQYDLSESIQEWIYKSFKSGTSDLSISLAILQISALSAERIPLPEALLPKTTGRWPVSHLLEDARTSYASLGLIKINADGDKYWALVHDILGRLLINALFYDFETRERLGFSTSKDAEHLRLELLKQLSQHRALGEVAYRSLAEDFATTIFKIDPDHGHSNFTYMWREVLAALDAMPRSIRDTSRVFRHHTAISRRRIARLHSHLFDVSEADKRKLLVEAIGDIEYALNFIDYTTGSESDLNLLNSLANAYLHLAEIEREQGATEERLSALRVKANDATRRAYAQNPTSTFVVETYIKNLLEIAESNPALASESCIEALGIVFSAVTSNEAAYRKSQLGELGDKALKLLLSQAPPEKVAQEPTSATDVLLQAWSALAKGQDIEKGAALEDVPEVNRSRALDLLAHPSGRGNMQVIRLRYDLVCVTKPSALKEQLELLQQLFGTSYRLTPQLRLEYAILLYQNHRAVEGDRIFKSLRPLWREGEYFVQVPERLRWLRQDDGRTLMTVHAVIGSDYGTRANARVAEFGNAWVPFRPEEHAMGGVRPGYRFSCLVSFGHNGPFLRPLTAIVH